MCWQVTRFSTQPYVDPHQEAYLQYGTRVPQKLAGEFDEAHTRFVIEGIGPHQGVDDLKAVLNMKPNLLAWLGRDTGEIARDLSAINKSKQVPNEWWTDPTNIKSKLERLKAAEPLLDKIDKIPVHLWNHLVPYLGDPNRLELLLKTFEEVEPFFN